MRSGERDLLLILLAVAAGSADGWSYVDLGHAFVANMTGNTVLLGLSVFEKNGDVLHPLLSLTCYAAGTLVATLLSRRPPAGALWPRSISAVLLLQGVIMACAAAAWGVMYPAGTSGPATINLLLGAVAFGVGVQSGAMLRLKIPGIVTTYITGTWTTMMSGLAKVHSREKPQDPNQKIQFENRLLMQAGILVVYFLSAVLTGWLFRYLPAGVGFLSAGPVLIVAAYGLVRGSSRPGPQPLRA